MKGAKGFPRRKKVYVHSICSVVDSGLCCIACIFPDVADAARRCDIQSTPVENTGRNE